MYINVRRYETHPNRTDQIIGKIQEGFLPILKAQPGFVSYEIFVAGKGVIVTMSKFEDESGAKASREKAAEWVQANVKDDFPNRPIIMAGEIKLST
ncbi:MAG: antibiotic biosynthesis monooxygenase [Proteobacteria bacterium]|nr:antibiotic biosynthesis monooxygenase [Pseudomonadota bacterium]MBU1584516.1 antibiotic biosynthesis monooxygenase [Pseudomonadota bacterium]MBU2451773.1 antibiotic biosynthesis monooxygenase [Pseudomonadota bacterium]MBU2630968.1 antibiotic biosynthesis monooxygenase [Pseudomonadota bacterium]